MIGADQLILLSDVDGLYTANPNINSDAQHIQNVDTITADILDMAGDAGSGLSKGGMKTKVLAARIATEAGCSMAITLGSPLNPLKQLQNGAKATWFNAQTDPVAIADPSGHVIAIGLTRYTGDEAAAIKGQHSDRIETILGYQGRAALIHRDDLVLQDRTTT